MKEGNNKTAQLIIVILVALVLCLISIIGFSFTDYAKQIFKNRGSTNINSNKCDPEGVENIRKTLSALSVTTSEFMEGNQTSEDSFRAAGNIMAYRDVLETTEVDPCAQNLKTLVILTFEEEISGHLAYGGLNYTKANQHWTKVSTLLDQVNNEFRNLGYEY